MGYKKISEEEARRITDFWLEEIGKYKPRIVEGECQAPLSDEEIQLVIKQDGWVECWNNQYPALKDFIDFEGLELGRERCLRALKKIFQLRERIPLDYLFTRIGITRDSLKNELKELLIFLVLEIEYLRREIKSDDSNLPEEIELLNLEIGHFESQTILLLSDNFIYGSLFPHGILFRIADCYLKMVVELKSKIPDDESKILIKFVMFKKDFINSIINQAYFWY